ncbi:inositol metabolism protein Opi10 [Coprinopsis cinerea okayama7|uniref:Inositol metabolism protein Opi10 n=1 Tax=Coprinopsis cinerea (strain Okayama-7 / 130 / ATCC MYA-4618 / FGSC 9003) TaxID=240176 RepID=A8NZU2_COPC7|nr:inositol metabolism protein Opi10 [Coprinopsis cinerea okayama7\|eukprot:XP_001837749.2 inositol metabolism protein Opi10 [Coprinopsis cinerea okayama7\
MLSNDKPSAIFRLRGTFSSASTPNSSAQNVFSQQSAVPQGSDVTAILGLAIEPLAQIQTQIASLPASQVNAALTSNALTKPPTVTDAVILAEKVVKHLLNYLSGFTGGSPGADVAIPMSIIVKWYESFMNKLKTGGVGFLERQE